MRSATNDDKAPLLISAKSKSVTASIWKVFRRDYSSSPWAHQLSASPSSPSLHRCDLLPSLPSPPYPCIVALRRSPRNVVKATSSGSEPLFPFWSVCQIDHIDSSSPLEISIAAYVSHCLPHTDNLFSLLTIDSSSKSKCFLHIYFVYGEFTVTKCFVLSVYVATDCLCFTTYFLFFTDLFCVLMYLFEI